MESRILLGHVLEKHAARLIVDENMQVSADRTKRYKKIMLERRKGVPVAYLTGNREFWSLPLMVNDQVLIPRHETEILVERVLALVDKCADARILELGTGSGAIALALASELPDAHLLATDNSASALAVARCNQVALGFENIEFVHSDWFENLGSEKYHLICSNPPYLSADDKHLNLGDVRFEPKAALVTGQDGYQAIEHIAKQAKTALRRGGWIVFEHGCEQGDSVRKLLTDYGYSDISTEQDLSGHERVTEARLP